MALKGEQGGEPRDDQDQGAGGPPRRDGLSDRMAPGAAPQQGSAPDLDDPSPADAPVVSGPLGFAHRMGSRSRSFAYDTEVFQGENLTYAILTQPSQGWVTDNGDGTFSFDPGLDFQDLKPDEFRRISFSYQVSDGWSGAETASASLTVTGTADGTLAIEMAADRPSRRTEPGEIVPPGGAPHRAPEPEYPEPSSAAPAEASWIARDLPDALADDATSAHGWANGLEPDLDTARDGNDNGQGLAEPVGSFPDESEDAETLEPVAAEEDDIPVPAWDSEPDQIPGAFGQTPLSDGEDPRSAELDPFVADPAPLDATPAIPEVDTFAAVSKGLQEGPYPAEPGFEPDGDDLRYTILAQPPEGQVSATESGEFEFKPGPDFPNLEIGELHQVSFTCEAADGKGATSIVIASLTITGTSEAPEICDVGFRGAQGGGMGHGADAIAVETPADAAPDTVDSDPGHWADPAASGPASAGESVGSGARWEDDPKPDHDGGPATSDLNQERPAETEAWDTTAEPTAATSVQPSWDPEVRTDVADAFVSPAGEAGAQGIGSDASDSGGPDRPQEEAASWETATIPPETPRPATQWTDAAGEGDALDQEPVLDVGSAVHDGDVRAESPVADEQSIAAAPGDLAADMPIGESTFPPTGFESAELEVAAGLGQDLGPGAEDSASGTAPAESTEVPEISSPYSGRQPEPQAVAGSEAPAISGPTGEQQVEPEAVASHDVDELFADDYRGAVAPEAVAAPLPERPDSAGQWQPEEGPETPSPPEGIAPEPAIPEESAAAVVEPDEQAIDLDGVFGVADTGGTPAQAAADPHEDTESLEDRHTPADGPTVTAEATPGEPSAMGTDEAVDDPTALRVSDAAVGEVEAPTGAVQDQPEGPSLILVADDEEEDDPAELSDFTLSQHTVVERCEPGTLVGQVLVAGAQDGSRFIFDLQNDAGGRFDINPRTGKVTVADGALLDHAAADSHDVLVQVIAHSGVSCRKTLTITVLPAGSSQAAAPEPEATNGPSEIAETPGPQTREQENGASREPAAPLESGREIYSVDDGKISRFDEKIAGGSDVDTLHLDGVAGGPGSGGWNIELTEGEIVETTDDHVRLSENSAGSVMLDGCPMKVAFEGVGRIEW